MDVGVRVCTTNEKVTNMDPYYEQAAVSCCSQQVCSRAIFHLCCAQIHIYLRMHNHTWT